MDLRTLKLHGHTVAYRTAGEGPVVLLVHGMAGNSATWSHVIPTLARRFTVVAPDLFGHGASSKQPLGEYSISGHANLLNDLLSALGHESATLVGQSLGGGVVMQLAYQFPETCERLVLVSSGGLGREVGALLRTLSLPGAEHVLPLVCSPKLRDVGARIGGWLAEHGLRASPMVEEIWRGYSGLADRDARLAFFRTLRAVVDPGGQAVSAIDRLYLASHTPLLIVWGGSDALIPGGARACRPRGDSEQQARDLRGGGALPARRSAGALSRLPSRLHRNDHARATLSAAATGAASESDGQSAGVNPFSRRASVRLEPNRLTNALAARRAACDEILDLTVSNPTECDLAWPPGVIEAIVAGVDSSRYRPEAFGLLEARVAICEDLARRGTHASPERLFLTASTSEAYGYLL